MALEMAAARGCQPGPKAVRAFPIDMDMGDLTYEPELAAKILKRRTDEMQRRVKLLDPRNRKCGVDVAFLPHQLAEKEAVAKAASEQNLESGHNLVVQKEILEAIEAKQVQVQRERKKEVVDYSLSHLRKELRREWDLNDPDQFKKEKPVDFEDPALGPSSFLKFKGDDPPLTKEKQQQQSCWLNEQLQIKREQGASDDKDDRILAMQNAMASRLMRLAIDGNHKAARDARKQTMLENQRLAESTKALQQDKLRKDQDLALQHVSTIRSDDRLREAIDWQLGSHGRYLKGEYKRLSAEQEQAIYDTNAQMIQSKQLSRTGVATLEKGAEKTETVRACNFLSILETEKMHLKKDRERAVVEENFRLAEERRKKAEELRLADKAFALIED